jgi:hypothetical protein
MHTMPENLMTTIETALIQAKYEGEAFVAYLLEMALIAAIEAARAESCADLDETGANRYLAVA